MRRLVYYVNTVHELSLKLIHRKTTLEAQIMAPQETLHLRKYCSYNPAFNLQFNGHIYIHLHTQMANELFSLPASRDLPVVVHPDGRRQTRPSLSATGGV